MLKVNNVRSGYEDLQIVNGISMEVGDKAIVAIVGANGVGKSTLLKTIVGLLKPMGGEITFDGQSIGGWNANKIVSSGISMVPEGRQLFGSMTVEENLYVGSCIKEHRLKRKENIEKMYAIFPRLEERSKQLAGTLSGGEQQMVATARALMSNPKLLIMDEPSWGLAPILVAELFETIKAVRDSGTSVLLVEQNVYQTLQMSDYGYVIEHGECVLQGSGEELLGNSDLKKAFLGV